jgi:hypothetical protein
MAEQSNPAASYLSNHTQVSLLVKLLAEIRVTNLILAQGFGISDDISALRNEVMAQGNLSIYDL